MYLEDRGLPMKLLAEISAGNYSSLPNKNLIRLFEALAQPKKVPDVEY